MFLNENGLHKGSPKFREEDYYSLLLMKPLGNILVNVCSKKDRLQIKIISVGFRCSVDLM